MEKIIFLINNDYEKLLDKKYLSKKYFNDNQIIHLSVIYNNIDLFNFLIKQEGKKILYKKNKYEENVFHLACKYNLSNFIDIILSTDINIINKIDKNGNIGLHYLLEKKKELLKLFEKFNKKIIEKNININQISNVYGSLLINFINNSKKKNDTDYELIKKILLYNINLDIPYNLPPLNLASKLNKEYIVDLLLNNKKIDVNTIDFDNITSIYYAVFNDNINLLDKLINKNANLNHYDDMNNIQFIFFVINNKKINILEYLLKNKNIDFNIFDKKLNLPINFVLNNKFNNKVVLELLLKTNNLNNQNIYGYNPLYFLLKNYNWRDFKDVLIKKKLDIFITNKEKEYIILNFIKEDKDFINLALKSMNINHIEDCNNKLKLDNCLKKINNINKNKKINFINLKKVDYTLFNSYFFYKYILYLYILKKYNNIYFPFLNKNYELKKIKNSKNDKYISLLNNWIKLKNNYGYKLKYMDILWINKKYYWINPYLTESIEFTLKKKKKRFMMISLIILQNNTNHQNIIIFDFLKKNVERFDPYGFINNNNHNDLDIILIKYIKKNFKNLKYFSPKSYMNRIGFQIISEFERKYDFQITDPDGFCLPWCFWYLEIKLKNPNLNNITLVKKSIKNLINIKITFNEYIRSYSNKLYQIIHNYFKDLNIILLKNINKKNLKLLYKKYIKFLNEFIK